MTGTRLRKIRSKKFKTKAEATAWAKEQKAKIKKMKSVKWETNLLETSSKFKWEAVVFGALRA